MKKYRNNVCQTEKTTKVGVSAQDTPVLRDVSASHAIASSAFSRHVGNTSTSKHQPRQKDKSSSPSKAKDKEN